MYYSKYFLAAFFFFLFLVSCQNTSPELKVTGGTVLQGNPIDIQVSGLAPDARVELSTHAVRMFRGKPYTYTSNGVFRADDTGVVNTLTSSAIEGTYTGISQSGLFWSRGYEALEGGSEADVKPLTIRADIDGDGVADLTQSLEIVASFENIRIDKISDKFPGAVIATPLGEGPWPAIIVLGGSEGGDRTAKQMAPRFASHGYLTLGLPYYSPSWGNQPQAVAGLPKDFVDIPVDKLSEAKLYLQSRSDVDSNNIGIWGVSKGAEYALLGGSLIEGFVAIAAIVPTDVVWEGWGTDDTTSSFSWKGEPLDFVPYKGWREEYAKTNPVIRNFHDAGRAAFPERVAAARIPVEKIDEPLFIVGGDKDIVWASGPMSRKIKSSRDAAGLETVMFVSEDAGHYLSGTGYSRAPQAEAKLKSDAWPALLEFFDSHLRD